MWNPPIWIYSEEHFVKLLFRYSPVHQWQWKKVEESEEVKGTVKHHCGPLEPHHITWLPGFVAQTKLHRGQLRTDEIAFAQTLYMQLYTPLPLQSSLSHIHKVKVQSLRFILHTDERRNDRAPHSRSSGGRGLSKHYWIYSLQCTCNGRLNIRRC